MARNVLFIMTDQQRWDCLGANGNTQIHTPHLDALAEDGITCSHSFTNATACVPSRACLMSGQYVHVHGVDTTGGTKWLRSETPTLPGCFTAAGYRTVGVGKMHFKPWHHLSGFERRLIADSKYDTSKGLDDYRRDLQTLGLQDKVVGHHTPGFAEAYKAMPSVELPPEWHIDAWIGRRGVESLEHLLKTPDPFFLAVSFCGPHDPYDPPPPYDTMYDPAEMPAGRWTEGELKVLADDVYQKVVDMGRDHLDLTAASEEVRRRISALYYGNITLIDDWVGRLVQTLKEADAYDDTVILFTSDHGDYLGDHALCYKGTFPCDADTRVPLVLKWPGLPAGRCDQLIGNVDVMPTLLAAAGVDIPSSCQGVDLGPYLASGKAPRDEVVIYNEPGPTYRLRTADWAYVFRPGGSDQLYYLPDDPHELHNLADRPSQASQLSLMQRRLTAWFVHHPGPCQEAAT